MFITLKGAENEKIIVRTIEIAALTLKKDANIVTLNSGKEFCILESIDTVHDEIRSLEARSR